MDYSGSHCLLTTTGSCLSFLERDELAPTLCFPHMVLLIEVCKGEVEQACNSRKMDTLSFLDRCGISCRCIPLCVQLDFVLQILAHDVPMSVLEPFLSTYCLLSVHTGKHEVVNRNGKLFYRPQNDSDTAFKLKEAQRGKQNRALAEIVTPKTQVPREGAGTEGGGRVWKSTVGVKVRKIGESPRRRVIVHGGSGSPRLGDAPNSTPPCHFSKKSTGKKRGPKMTKIDQNRPKITKIDQIWPPTKSPREGPGPFREVFRGQKRPSSGSTVPDMAHPRPSDQSPRF